jgi:hypothetical protein
MNSMQAIAASEMTVTENGALTHRSSGTAVLDFYSRISAMRDADRKTVQYLFEKAFKEDPLLAMKALFNSRDVRSGQGERKVFRTIWKYLATLAPEIFKKNIENVPFYGRWDDLLESLTPDVISFIKSKMDSKEDNLLYKWLPSENTSSKDTRLQAKRLREALELSPRQYRKILVEGRARAKIIEAQMSAGEWSEIEYSRVPSQASRIYRKAFSKHDQDRYGAFIQKALTGEVKINASVTYPYEIVREFMQNRSDADATLEAIWKQLPDYVNGDFNAIVMADTSGSMTTGTGLPIQVAVSLAMYFAERNKSKIFGGKFLTFSSRPRLQDLVGRTLRERIQNLARADWGGSTDLNAAFELLLSAATKFSVPANEMPKKIFIVSDMQFDQCTSRNRKTNYETIQKRYREAGYELPSIVFWNVAAKVQESPITVNDEGMMVSGCSPTIFKNVLLSKCTTPYDMMLEVLNSDRYDRVVV